MKHICFAYSNSKQILTDLDLEIGKQDRIGLIGQNGCGKSTLLHLMVGLLTPNSGTITVFGKEVKTEKDFVEVRKKVGFLFQNSDDQLFCPTVLEDVAFGLLNQGKKPQEAKEMAMNTLKQLQLERLESRIIHQLSGGEKKLVALATVITMQPEILLLDEPVAGLDPMSVERITDILENLDFTMIIVSHEYEFLKRLSCNIIGIEQGRINIDQNDNIMHNHIHRHKMGNLPHRH